MDDLKLAFEKNLEKSVPLEQFTTLKIGGPAKYFYVAKTVPNLIKAITGANKMSLPYLIIGGGSNLLISDAGFNGLVIKNQIIGIKDKGTSISVKSGTPLQLLVSIANSHGLTGLQKLIGIPGTVGGAVFGNAGAYGQAISDYLEVVTAYNPEQNIKVTLSKKDCGFGYRDSNFKRNGLIILRARFKFEKADPAVLAKVSAEILSSRSVRYPLSAKCPGCFFKNIIANSLDQKILKNIPPEMIIFGKIPAGFLLDQVGAKGDKLGQIAVSKQHANLFINLNKGKASDFYLLTKKYYRLVKEKFNISLEPEVQLINIEKFN